MTKLKTSTREYTAMENGQPIGPKNGELSNSAKVYVSKPEPGEEEEDSPLCGWGALKPSFCQRFRNPKWVLFWLCWAGAIQGMTVNGFINVVITNIERRFDLTSTTTGTIASCYDIASVLCLIPVTYFGGQGIKPRYLGIGVFLIGLGSLVFALPHFISGLYVYEDFELVCKLHSNVTEACDAANLPRSLSDYKYYFFLGQILHGAGASPLYTLGVTYLDDNVSQRSSSFYVGTFFAFSILGPAIGYVSGSQFIYMYTDIDSVDTNSISIDQNHPKWVGAWWIGFLIAATLGILVSFPLIGFPKSLPGSSKYKAEKGKEVYKKKKLKPDIEQESKLSVKRILGSVKVLLTNPTFMFLNLSAASEGMLLSGLSTFTPKFLEAQFSLPSSTAALYVGFAAIPGGGGGTFLGGYIVKKFNLKVRGIIRMCLCGSVTVLTLACVFLIQCETLPFAGVNVHYQSSSRDMRDLGGQFEHACNANCSCQPDEYQPVCGSDGVRYFSPCLAGCQSQLNGKNYYANCSCISENFPDQDYAAETGKCSSSCIYLPLFMVIFFLIIFFTFLISMPALSATLRCVPGEVRSFGLGIQWIITRCLGTIPGPILYGTIIDLTCLLWQNKCDEKGSCYFYNNQSMGLNFLAIGLVGKLVSTTFFILALKLYKSPLNEEEINLQESASVSSSSHNSGTLKVKKDEGDAISSTTAITDTEDFSNSPVKILKGHNSPEPQNNNKLHVER